MFQEYSRSLMPWTSVGQQRAAAAPAQEAAAEGAAEAGRGVARGGRADRVRRPLPMAALGRHAAARRDRPRARVPAVDPADGRAVRLGRRPDPRRPRGSDPARARGVRDHDPVRDPRHRRVGLPRRPGGGPDPRTDGGQGDRLGSSSPSPRSDRDQGATGFRPSARPRLSLDQAGAGGDARRRRAGDAGASLAASD